MYDGRTIWFVIRGIAGHPSDLLEWEFVVRNKIITQLQIPAIAISYATNFWSVWQNRKNRALQSAKNIKEFSARDWRINIIAHSEGTVVATDALQLLGWPRVEALHLVCGACDSDFGRLGLNDALRQDRIGAIHCYMAGHDTAMQFENLTLGRMLFQIHRPLGLHGPTNVNQMFKEKVIEHWEYPWDTYGHSTCWEKMNMDRTMAGFLSP